MRDGSLTRYISSMTCLLAFALRIHYRKTSEFIGATELKLNKASSSACTELLQRLPSGSPDSKSLPVHRLILSLLKETSDTAIPTGTRSIAMMYTILDNVTSSGMIHPPGRINGTLSELKWTFRASEFREIMLRARSAHIEIERSMEEGDDLAIGGGAETLNK